MNPFYFVIGAFVIAIAHFKMELLVNRQSLRVIFSISLVLFACGLVLPFTEAGNDTMSGALLCPLLSLGLFCWLRKLFLLRFRRELVDTFLIWNGRSSDILFNLTFFLSATLLLIFLPFGMQQLANDGW
jgi:hypothetical protein